GRLGQGTLRAADSRVGPRLAPAADALGVHRRRLDRRDGLRRARRQGHHGARGAARDGLSRHLSRGERRRRAPFARASGLCRGPARSSVNVATRLVGAIWLAALVVIGGFTYLPVGGERQRLFQDRERRAAVLGEGLAEAAEPALARGSRPALERLLVKFGQPEQRLAFFDRVGTVQAASASLRPVLAQAQPEVTAALAGKEPRRGLVRLGGRPGHGYSSPVVRDGRVLGALLVALDAEPVVEAEWRLWRDNGIRFLVLAVVLSIIAFLIVRISVIQPLTKMARWTKALRRGMGPPPLDIADPSIFGPVAHEVSVMAKSLHRARAAAEEEAALRLVGEALWTEERLKQFVKLRLPQPPPFPASTPHPLR